MKKLLALALVFCSSAIAGERVDLLATAVLDNHEEAVFLPVNSCFDDREFVSAVKIVVRRDSARIDDVVVKFGDGEEQHLDIRDHFTQGSESRWVDLYGARRCIRFVKVLGKSGPHGRRTFVEVYGRTESLFE